MGLYRHAKTHAIRVSIMQIRSFWYTHACGPFHSLKSSFKIFEIGPLLKEIRVKNWSKVLPKIYPIVHYLKVKNEKNSGGGPPDPPL